MFWRSSGNLLRSLVHNGSRSAAVRRQPCRFLESISYDKDFRLVKPYRRDDSSLDEKSRRIRSASEDPFLKKGVNIEAYSEYGFRLNNIKTLGPVALFPRAAYPWYIAKLEDINEQSLCIFYLVKPKIDTLIIGTGDQEVPKSVVRTILDVTRKHRINIEILSTDLACTTFNFLQTQDRMVGAALVPPLFINFDAEDLAATQARDGKLFSMEKMSITAKYSE